MTTAKTKICSIEGCGRTVQARGLCPKHYQEDRARRNGAHQCSAPSCTLLATLDGLCRNHYMRRRRVENRAAEVAGKRCGVEGCWRAYDAGGYCNTHYQRARQNDGDPGPAEIRQNGGDRFKIGGGYMGVLVDGRKVAEHRFQMEQMLGRSLYPGETVRHKNGIKHDNARSNLELWVTPQPSGQRPEDLVEWVIAHYRSLVVETLERM
jgi:hypothetical protein